MAHAWCGAWKGGLAVCCALVIVLFGGMRIARAGGGPENVLLVVNSESPVSHAVANFYQSLRQIPDSNVLYLAWDPKEQVTDVDRFRAKILLPIIEHLTRQGALEWIDCVAYSADFPWGIDLRKDIERLAEEHPELLPPARPGGPSDEGKSAEEQASARWPRVLTPRGSLNGLTYLYAGVLARRPDYYMSLRVNQYMRRAIPEQKELPTLGFTSRLPFDEHGNLAKQGQRYLLSMVLAVAADEDTRGNTLEEIFEYLRRSAAADASFPRGTIYFVQNDDIRSRTRDPAFPEVVEALAKLNVRAEIVHGIMPENKPDCQGVMMGTAQFDWARSGSTILPGAICDHLTSLGGVMAKSAGQTPLTEFLRYGAAAASGTVTEPFAIAEKFPLPTIHLHYARGCSAAEAFYQSVYGPYQLLIVGDPLCRPWANIPVVKLKDLPEGKTVRGVVTLRPEAHFPRPGLPPPIGGGQVDHFEWFVDGRLVGRSGPNEAFTIDTTKWDDGYHEVRVVAVETGLIASRGGRVVGLTCDNFGSQISVKLQTPHVRLGEPVHLHVESPGALALVVRQNGRVLARKIGEKADFEIDSRKLGMGPVRLQAIGLAGPGRPRNTISRPMDVIIERE
ncbi:MAG: hypothetical protein H5U08_03500 [Thermogutta sp.]|uniref:hypothetical protein n=1 Tax=Thermogutta sp. TaxID=1962930 RepID=UPI0019AB85D0|nr:hypothetical protein [Thermogutta sp.]MBC7351401.1 hypothetical protein [Thermogutta sp.]